MQGHFATLQYMDSGVTHLSLLSVLSCAPSGARGKGVIQADAVTACEFMWNNFTCCYANESSAFCGYEDFVARMPVSYLNIYGCSGNAAFRYEPFRGNLTIHHSNFYNNTTEDVGTIHVWENGTLSVEWSVFQGNTIDMTGNNQTSISDCVFDKQIPSDVIDEGGNRVIADAPSWYLYGNVTLSCWLFDAVPSPSMTFTQSRNFHESLPVERSQLRESAFLNLSELDQVLTSQQFGASEQPSPSEEITVSEGITASSEINSSELIRSLDLAASSQKDSSGLIISLDFTASGQSNASEVMRSLDVAASSQKDSSELIRSLDLAASSQKDSSELVKTESGDVSIGFNVSNVANPSELSHSQEIVVSDQLNPSALDYSSEMCVSAQFPSSTKINHTEFGRSDEILSSQHIAISMQVNHSELFESNRIGASVHFDETDAIKSLQIDQSWDISLSKPMIHTNCAAPSHLRFSNVVYPSAVISQSSNFVESVQYNNNVDLSPNASFTNSPIPVTIIPGDADEQNTTAVDSIIGGVLVSLSLLAIAGLLFVVFV
jgi:hypothetical protein